MAHRTGPKAPLEESAECAECGLLPLSDVFSPTGSTAGGLSPAEGLSTAGAGGGSIGGGSGSTGGGSGSTAGGSGAGEVESLLGQLEDKLAWTQAEIHECRRANYFPASEGYRLRFSYKDMYIGFKDLLMEQVHTNLSMYLSIYIYVSISISISILRAYRRASELSVCTRCGKKENLQG